MNLSVKTDLPQEWTITMIPKKDVKTSDPSEYRPISLTSCLGKLAERLIKSRLYAFLEKNNVLVTSQSGFREKRGAADNLLFFKQKINECLIKKKTACCVFFDISKAFDKVWHQGLLYKLIKLCVPSYIINFVKNFLQNRTFKIKINGNYSEKKILNVRCLKVLF